MDVQKMDNIFDENANIDILYANVEDNKIEEGDLTKHTTEAQVEMHQSDAMEDLASVLYYLNLAPVSWNKQTPKKEPVNEVPETLGHDDLEKFLNGIYTSGSSKPEEAHEENTAFNGDSNNADQTTAKPDDYDNDFLLINFDEELSNDVFIEDNEVPYHYLL